MVKRLPSDVVAFLRDNPKEVEKIQHLMKAIASNAAWKAEIAAKRAAAPMVPCGTYGCTSPRNEMDAMCGDCRQEYRDDPDAFK